MSLISCPECDRLVSSLAAACVECGYPLAGIATADGSARFAGTYTAPEPAPPVNAEYSLFPVTTTKFVVMAICTFGMYEVYWCYRTWQRLAPDMRESVSPFWRAFFTQFWTFSLFARIGERAARRHQPVAWSAGALGAAYLALTIVWRLPDPWWAVGFAGFVPFVPVVRTVERLHAEEHAAESRNGSFSGWNIVGIVIGGLAVLLVLLALAMPAEG